MVTASNLIKQVGNYYEISEGNLGSGSPSKLPRGLNALWSSGCLVDVPPLR